MLAAVTLLSYDCPVQAIVAGLELDERTVARWQKEAGSQCRRVYNLLLAHRSLGEERAPAMAAGLTDHRWSMEELLSYAVPSAKLPKLRGGKPKWLVESENAA
jgi:hypothetical protein